MDQDEYPHSEEKHCWTARSRWLSRSCLVVDQWTYSKINLKDVREKQRWSSIEHVHICLRWWVEWPLMTIFFLVSPVLYSLILLCPCTLIVCVCMRACRKRERERERDPRAANRRRRSEGQAKRARERNRVKGTGHYKDAENERKKCIAMKRTIIWRFTVGRSSGVAWWWWRRSLLFFLPLSLSFALHFSFSLSFAQHATSGLSSQTTLPFLLTTSPFFAVLLPSFCKKRPMKTTTATTRWRYDVTTTSFFLPILIWWQIHRVRFQSLKIHDWTWSIPFHDVSPRDFLPLPPPSLSLFLQIKERRSLWTFEDDQSRRENDFLLRLILLSCPCCPIWLAFWMCVAHVPSSLSPSITWMVDSNGEVIHID